MLGKILGYVFISLLCVALGAGLRLAQDEIFFRLGVNSTDNYNLTDSISVETHMASGLQPADSREQASVGEKTVKILFVGDMMLDRGVRHYVDAVGGGDPDFSFKKISEYLKSFDAVIPNLEGPVSDTGVLSGSIYSFRMNPDVIPVFVKNNIIAVNFANNHAWDYGRAAFEDTITRLRENGIGVFGAGMNEIEAYSPRILEINGIRIALLGFTEFLEHVQADDSKSGVAFADEEKIKTAVRNVILGKFDAIAVIFHFGEEYTPEPAKSQKHLARLAIEAGADLVVGHHPHVIQTSEQYLGKMIFYSLGNFVFDQNFSEETMAPGFLEVEVSKNGVKSAVLKKGSMTEFYEVMPPVY